MEMNRKTLHVIWFATFALLMVLSRARRAEAEDQQAPYWRMAPLGQYLMADRNAEIALARSAAPESISSAATVLVLGEGAATKQP